MTKFLAFVAALVFPVAGITADLPAGVGTANTAVDLPDMGESIDRFLSAAEEQQLGEAFMRNVRRSLSVMDDIQITRYINSLGQRLATFSNQPQRGFSFFVVDDPNINAFAGPGGYIGINAGLILAAQDEDELAAVIAHEIAHVTQRHLARAYENTNDMSLPMTAAIIAAIVLGNQPGMGQLSEATIASAAAGSIQKQINFTRSNEQEADRIGMQILSQAAYDNDAMQRFFTRLLQQNQYQEDASLEFLRTHPLTINRIAGSISLQVNTSAHTLAKNKSSAHEYFLMMQHRIRVFISTNSAQLSDYYASQSDASNANKYGKALAATRLRQYQAADKILADLLTDSPDNLQYLLAKIENEITRGDAQQAVALLSNKLRLYPNDIALSILYAQALLKDGQYINARDLLRKFIYKVKPTPLLFSLLAESEGKSNNVVAAHQALAEYYFLNGDSVSALKQIDLALQQDKELLTNDRARIEARRKLIKQTVDSENRP